MDNGLNPTPGDLDCDRECSVPPLPGDIAEISSNSDGDTWSFQKDYWPQIQIESARLSPCGVDIDVGFFPTVLGVGLNPTPMAGRWVKSHVLSHCFGCWVKSHPCLWTLG